MRQLPLLAALLLVTPALAGQADFSPRCAAPTHRAFDYWVGEWEVLDSTGTKLGESSITQVSGGCAIAEHWRPVMGREGRSLTWFSIKDSLWHQAYVGANAWTPHYRGGITDGEMMMEESPDEVAPGRPISRMRYYKKPGGEVQQVLWVSTDRGASWSLGFLGNYRRKP